MSGTWTEEEFVGKIDWEGGPWEAARWGLTASDLENPDSRLGRAWAKFEEYFNEHGQELMDAMYEDSDD